nr:lysine-rich arabinogalactan protein 19-like [Aegilops tauschii subsp. strangulata]
MPPHRPRLARSLPCGSSLRLRASPRSRKPLLLLHCSAHARTSPHHRVPPALADHTAAPLLPRVAHTHAPVPVARRRSHRPLPPHRPYSLPLLRCCLCFCRHRSPLQPVHARPCVASLPPAFACSPLARFRPLAPHSPRRRCSSPTPVRSSLPRSRLHPPPSPSRRVPPRRPSPRCLPPWGSAPHQPRRHRPACLAAAGRTGPRRAAGLARGQRPCSFHRALVAVPLRPKPSAR